MTYHTMQHLGARNGLYRYRCGECGYEVLADLSQAFASEIVREVIAEPGADVQHALPSPRGRGMRLLPHRAGLLTFGQLSLQTQLFFIALRHDGAPPWLYRGQCAACADEVRQC